MLINNDIKIDDLTGKINNFWELSAIKIKALEQYSKQIQGAPVVTIDGKYTSRKWTEWTYGFQFGSYILQYDATGEKYFLERGRTNTLEKMSPQISHTGIHDHAFNNLSTYGNLLRLMRESRIDYNEWERNFYELALKISGAVQASRWTKTGDGGYIFSFNGPHSLFVDTIRSCRILAVSHLLGHVLKAENDTEINLLGRALKHIETTAKYSIFYGEGRDRYDEWGRTAHECIFNMNDGSFRCCNSQQGYSAFTTWTRGLAWAMLGFAEELELVQWLPSDILEEFGGKAHLVAMMMKPARATCEFYIKNTPADGIPYWDTGAPDLCKLGNYLEKPADPFNQFEPVDSSAAVIAAQGLMRLGNFLIKEGNPDDGKKYWQAGLTVVNTLLGEPYLCTDHAHQGLILHSVYHRPNNWDHISGGRKIPCNESSMWGDYHARELAVYLQRVFSNKNYYTFFNFLL